MRTVSIALAWIASLVAAWLLGTTMAPEEETPAPAVGGREAPGPTEPAAGLRLREPAPPPALPGRPGDAASGGDPGPTTDASRTVPIRLEDVEPFTFEGVTSAQEANDRMMRHVAQLLAAGPEGHLAVLAWLTEHVVDNDDLENLLGNDEQAARFLYPWIKFVVSHEDEMVALTETVYTTMAERPQVLEDVDNDALELFTEGISMVLPGAVSPERLDRFRSLAEAILETPEAEQPESVRRNRHRIERVLSAWAPALSDEEAVERLLSGEAPPREVVSLLQRIPADAVARLDVGSLLAPLIAAGEWRAVNLLPRLALSSADVAVLDRAYLQGAVQEGRYHPFFLSQYLEGTRRHTWPAGQSLVAMLLDEGGAAFQHVVAAFQQRRPGAEAVRWVLDRYPMPDEATRRALEGLLR